MKYKIITDSSCDLTMKMEDELGIESVPFKIDVEDRTFVDDEDLDIQEFIDTMVASKEAIKTSCPSPSEYLEAIEKFPEAEGHFIITISSKLSGSFNAVNTAVDMYNAEHPKSKICILDSKSAAAGQTNVALKLHDLISSGMDFDSIAEEMKVYIDNMNTFFVLESLDNLIKNGRIKKSAGLIANVLNIKPVMTANDGKIELHEMNRGFNRALNKISETVGELGTNIEEKVLCISHVNALEKATYLADKIAENYKFKDVVITHTKGLASGYAYDGGIVVAY